MSVSMSMSMPMPMSITDPPMLVARHSTEDTVSDVIMSSSITDGADSGLSEYKEALKEAKEDALETANALETLVQGIQAVKRILERPFDEAEKNCTDVVITVNKKDDVEIVSTLSTKLVGVLGSELIGLLNAAQMTKSHAKLCVQEHEGVLQDFHRAKEVAEKANVRADRLERIGRRLKKEKKVLVQEVRALRGNRRVLVQEVKSMRKLAKRSKQSEALRLLRDAVKVHETVLRHKTFTSGFDGIDPPGMMTGHTDIQDEVGAIQTNSNIETSKEHDFAKLSPSSNKKNNEECIYVSRKENPNSKPVENIVFGVCKNAQHANKPFADTAMLLAQPNLKLTPEKDSGNKTAASSPTVKTPPETSQPLNSMPRSELKPTVKSSPSPSPTKQRKLGFARGFGSSLSNGLGRFKNVLQEASDQLIHPELYYYPEHEQQPQQRLPLTSKEQTKAASPSGGQRNDVANHNRSMTLATSENDCKLVDDATKSTQYSSFETNLGEMNSSLNVTASVISCGEDETPGDLAFQISIDEGSSFLNSSRIHHEDSPSSRLVVTPDTSPFAGHPISKDSDPMFNENVLRTLSVPSQNHRNTAMIGESRTLKPRQTSLQLMR